MIFSKARGGGDGVGVTRVGKGLKIVVAVDARGPPVAVNTAHAGAHESKLVQRIFDFMLTQQTRPRVIGGKAYDCEKLDAELADRGVELTAPHCANRKSENVTQDRGLLQGYRRRWKVERSIAWIQSFRRLCIRWERSTMLFQGFLHLRCTQFLLRPIVG